MSKAFRWGQSSRIFACLNYNHGKEISATVLHNVGSSRGRGFCASLSRRISDIRDLGHHVQCRREVVDGQTRTFYTMLP